MIIEDALAALDRFGHVEIERRKPSNTVPLPWTVTIWDYPSGRGTGNNLPEAIEDALRDFEEAERIDERGLMARLQSWQGTDRGRCAKNRAEP